MFLTAVGHEASWQEGCYCCGHILSEAATYHQRRKLLGGSAECPWKGARGISWALGHKHLLTRNILEASSPRFQNMLITTVAEVADKMVHTLSLLGRRWLAIVLPKNEHWLHPPYSVVAAMGQYVGFSKSQCKAAIRDTFFEWDAQEDKAFAHRVGFTFFERNTSESCQLERYGQDADLDLHAGPDAFIACQELLLLLLLLL